MLFSRSLRLRLLILILFPLMVVAASVVSWQFHQANRSAETVFDQKLAIIALAIFRDLLATEGENLSPATKALFEEASGATFFYHVRGPDGGFVTGYSPPPVKPKSASRQTNEMVFFVSTHRGKPVKVVQLNQQAKVDELTGLVSVSVWQNLAERREFAQFLAMQGVIIALLLVFTASLVVFFGIRVGLRPLKSLEDAILRRSSSDLSPIMREVPNEVRHIVHRLNDLFAEVTQSQKQKDRFISNAAHQLRNPVTGISTMAEVTQKTKDPAKINQRLKELRVAAKRLSRLTEQMLSFERLQQRDLKKTSVRIDEFLQNVSTSLAEMVLSHKVEFSLSTGAGNTRLDADMTLLEQAFTNLVDNALKHGGPSLSEIVLSSEIAKNTLKIHVSNDGDPVNTEMEDRLFERFEQGMEGHGAGLGLAIVREIVQQHGASVSYSYENGWCRISMIFDLNQTEHRADG
ncbi:MAG: sensor histidine kinase [Alphaproteobacteria bacterium]|nr:sensor histidine kinase [Alphaproteobacteria bacterium]